jgi:hypothetical protein
MGSDITNVTLPSYGILNEVRLPSTIKNLNIIGHSNLTKNNFTIGTCNYNAETKEKVYTSSSGKLISLRVEDTPIDSYALIKENPNLQYFYLKGIDWTIDDASELTINDNIVTLNILETLLNILPI